VTHESDITDARDLSRLLGIEHRVISIEPVLGAYRRMPGYTENRYLLGNLMARTRMTILYYHANRDNMLVCGTSNKSEYLLGYCTKYGDNAADLQPIVHLLKREVYETARDLGIPGPILTKPPSAGLWAGQSDEEEIGIPYAEIDTALAALEQQQWTPRTPVEERVLAMVKKSEHKRLPAPSLAGVL
jgi:NAD+ synthase